MILNKFRDTANSDQKIEDLELFSFNELSNRGEKSDRSITFAEGTTGVIAFGATGSGKTASVMRPVLSSLVLQGFGGLVLDVKGDYAAFLQQNCPEDSLVVIGDNEHSVRTNLLSGMTLEQFRGLMEDMGVQSGDNSFWGTGGVRDSVLVFNYFRAAENRNPTLAEVYEALDSPKTFAKNLDSYLRYASEIPVELSKSINACVEESFSILKIGESATCENAPRGSGTRDDEQYTWHTQKLKHSLRSFSDNPVLRSVFCLSPGDEVGSSPGLFRENGKQKDNSIYEMAKAGKTICLDINAARYGVAAKFASRLMKARFYADVFQSNINEVRKDRYTFLLVDEYQDFISSNKEGEGALYDDTSFFDKSRAYRHINILATQGISSLVEKTGSQDTVHSILQNLRTRIVLPTADERTLELVGKPEELRNPPNFGKAGVVFYVHKQTNVSSDAYLIRGITNSFIDAPDFESSGFQAKQNGGMVPNNLISSKRNFKNSPLKSLKNSYSLGTVKSKEDLERYFLERRGSARIVIVAPETSLVLDDFCTEFEERFKDFKKVGGFKSGKFELNSINLKVADEFVFYPIPSGTEASLAHEVAREVYEVYNSLYQSSVRGEISNKDRMHGVVVIRGGGDDLRETYDTKFFSAFAPEYWNAMSEENILDLFAFSIGHASDNKWFSEGISAPEMPPSKTLLNGITPTQLGRKMCDYLMKVRYGYCTFEEKHILGLLSYPEVVRRGVQKYGIDIGSSQKIGIMDVFRLLKKGHDSSGVLLGERDSEYTLLASVLGGLGSRIDGYQYLGNKIIEALKSPDIHYRDTASGSDYMFVKDSIKHRSCLIEELKDGDDGDVLEFIREHYLEEHEMDRFLESSFNPLKKEDNGHKDELDKLRDRINHISFDEEDITKREIMESLELSRVDIKNRMDGDQDLDFDYDNTDLEDFLDIELEEEEED